MTKELKKKQLVLLNIKQQVNKKKELQYSKYLIINKILNYYYNY